MLHYRLEDDSDAIPIHDSFIVQEKHWEKLLRTMMAVWQDFPPRRARIAARKKQDVSTDVEGWGNNSRTMLNSWASALERDVENVIAQEDNVCQQSKAPPIHTQHRAVSAAMLIRGNSGTWPDHGCEATAMTSLAPVPHDSGEMRGRWAIVGGGGAFRERALGAALAAAYHDRVLRSAAKHLNERGKPHKPVIIAIAQRQITIANAILGSTEP